METIELRQHVLLVEGHGEVYAASILVRRIADSLGLPCIVRSVLRQPRSTILKGGELERAVTLLGNKVGRRGAGVDRRRRRSRLHARPGAPGQGTDRTPRSPRRHRARGREYEAWFLAAAASLRGRRGLPDDLEVPASPEILRDAQGWLGARMPRGYSPTTDQPGLTGLFDLALARNLPSFDKLVRELTRLLADGDT